MAQVSRLSSGCPEESVPEQSVKELCDPQPVRSQAPSLPVPLAEEMPDGLMGIVRTCDWFLCRKPPVPDLPRNASHAGRQGLCRFPVGAHGRTLRRGSTPHRWLPPSAKSGANATTNLAGGAGEHQMVAGASARDGAIGFEPAADRPLDVVRGTVVVRTVAVAPEQLAGLWVQPPF